MRPQIPAQDPARLRDAYLQAAARDWGMLRLEETEGAPEIPLTQVFVLLQAAQREPPRPRQPPPSDVLPAKERLEHAGLLPEAQTAQPSPPVPLGQALKQAQHLVLLGEPGPARPPPCSSSACASPAPRRAGRGRNSA